MLCLRLMLIQDHFQGKLIFSTLFIILPHWLCRDSEEGRDGKYVDGVSAMI
jgi:hypothetical protein